jgi:hypothetical protein
LNVCGRLDIAAAGDGRAPGVLLWLKWFLNLFWAVTLALNLAFLPQEKE